MSTENQTKTEISFDELQETFAFTIPGQEEIKAEVEDVELTDVDLSKGSEEEEIATPPAAEEAKTEIKVSDNFYVNLLKKNLEKGLWEDVIIEEGEDSFKLSELDNLSEEEYFKLLEDQETLKKEDLKDKTITVDGLSEEKRLLIEIVKNGGDLKEIFKDPSQMQKPFDSALGWDLDNEEHQYAIVYQQYKAQGLSEERAKLNADADLKELTLDTKAQEIVEFHQKAFDEKLKKVNADLIEEKKKEQEELTTYKKSLTKMYKEDNLPEALSKKLVDLATRETDKGFAVDDIYEQMMKDPEQAKELIFFLADKEKYLQQKTLNTKIKTNAETMRTIKRVSQDREKKPDSQEEERSSGFVFSVPTI